MLTPKGITAALGAFKDISAFDAIECLCTSFKASSARVFVNGIPYAVEDLYDMNVVYYDLLARDFCIEFYGGPPQDVKMYKGTLMTLVVDHFLYAYTRNEEKRIQEALKYVSIPVTT